MKIEAVKFEISRPGDMLRRASMQARQIDEVNHRATFAVSPPTVDRHGTIFNPDKWRLENYRANPQFVWGHRAADGDHTDALGIGYETWTDSTEGLVATLQYDVDNNPVARRVFEMVVSRTIRAVSHWTRVDEIIYWDDSEDRLGELSGPLRAALKNGSAWGVCNDNELIEISQVLVGSNPQALRRALESAKTPKMFAMRTLSALPPTAQERNSRMSLPAKTEPKRTLGDILRGAREAANLQPSEVAAQLSVDETTLRALEAGDILRTPSEVVEDLSTALGVDATELREAMPDSEECWAFRNFPRGLLRDPKLESMASDIRRLTAMVSAMRAEEPAEDEDDPEDEEPVADESDEDGQEAGEEARTDNEERGEEDQHDTNAGGDPEDGNNARSLNLDDLTEEEKSELEAFIDAIAV